MIAFVDLLFRFFLRERLVRSARGQSDRGLAGAVEGHAAMDMSIQQDGSFARRLFSGPGYTAVADVFVMEWAAIARDLIIGLLIAGAMAAWVPADFCSSTARPVADPARRAGEAGTAPAQPCGTPRRRKPTAAAAPRAAAMVPRTMSGSASTVPSGGSPACVVGDRSRTHPASWRPGPRKATSLPPVRRARRPGSRPARDRCAGRVRPGSAA